MFFNILSRFLSKNLKILLSSQELFKLNMLFWTVTGKYFQILCHQSKFSFRLSLFLTFQTLNILHCWLIIVTFCFIIQYVMIKELTLASLTIPYQDYMFMFVFFMDLCNCDGIKIGFAKKDNSWNLINKWMYY